MNLIDCYNSFSVLSREEVTLKESVNIPIFLKGKISLSLDEINMLKIAIKQKYGKYHVNVLRTDSQDEEKLGKQCSIGMLSVQIIKPFFQFFVQIKINLTNQQIVLNGFYLANGLPVYLQTKHSIYMNLSLAMNLNRYLSPIKININPKLGQICLTFDAYFQLNDQVGKGEDDEITKKLFVGIDLLEKNRLVLLCFIKQEFCHLHSLISENEKLRKNIELGETLLSRLQKSLYCMNLSVYDSQNRLDYNMKRQQFVDKVCYLNDELMDVLFEYIYQEEIKKHNKVDLLESLSNQNYQDQSIQMYSDVVQQKINYNIFTRMVLVGREEFIVWNTLAKGGYGKVETADVKVYLGADLNKKNNILQLKITRKSDKSKSSESRLLHEKEIIKNMKNLAHPNITSFLQLIPSDVLNKGEKEVNKYLQNEKYIYSLFQVNTSLDSFLRKNECLSLFSKLFTLEQAAKGLLFLHTHKIVHIDFKPANLLIGKHCLAKVGDFGESLRLGDDKSYYPASTFPYSPPEYQMNELLLLTEKVDVYSFGVTILQCLFSNNIKKYMLERQTFRKNSSNNFIELPYIQPERIPQFGNRRVMSILAFLCLRCINVNVGSRPSMTWVVTILQYCRKYLQLLQYK